MGANPDRVKSCVIASFVAVVPTMLQCTGSTAAATRKMARLFTSAAALLAVSAACSISSADAFAPLSGATATSVSTGANVDLSNFLSDKSGSGYNMLVVGTYAADFNAIEYAQRLRYYLPKLQEAGVGKVGFLLNCEADAAKALCDYTDLPMTSPVDILIDPLGEVGRKFGVEEGGNPTMRSCLECSRRKSVHTSSFLVCCGGWAPGQLSRR